MNKKLLALLLTLSLTLSMLPWSAMAEEVEPLPEEIVEELVDEAPAIELGEAEDEYAALIEQEIDLGTLEGEPEEAVDAGWQSMVFFDRKTIYIGVGEGKDPEDPVNLSQYLVDEEGEAYEGYDVEFSAKSTKYITLTEDGDIVGVKKGSTTVTVKKTNGNSDTCKVTVRSAPSKVTVTDKDGKTIKDGKLKLMEGEEYPLTVSLSSSTAGHIKSWSSSNESVAEVDPDTGVVTATGKGKATITAETYNGKKGTVEITVLGEPTYLGFDINDITMYAGGSYDLTDKISIDAEDVAITYTSSDSAVAAVTGKSVKEKVNGKSVYVTHFYVSAKKAGEAVITAKTYNGLTDTLAVSVVALPKSLKLPISTLYIGVGDTYEIDPIIDGDYLGLTYKSSREKCAAVDEYGELTALKAGSTTVTVSINDKLKATMKVVVRKAPSSITLSSKTLTMGVGEVSTLKYTLSKSSYASVEFDSSDPGVVDVDEDGNLTALDEGSATITATTYNGKEATCKVTVKPGLESLECEQSSLELARKDTAKLDVTLVPANAYTKITYSSANTKVATVNDKGVVTGKAAGNTTVRIQSSTPGIYVDVPVTVYGEPTKVTLPDKKLTLGIDETYTLEPEIPDNTRTTFTYKSSNAKVAEVDSDGVITALKMGTATITVTTHNRKTASVSVTVVDPFYPESLDLLEKVPKLSVDEDYEVDIDVLPYTADANLIWKSSNTKVVTVDDGMLHAVKSGTATITVVAEENSKCKLSFTVTVTGGGSSSGGDDDDDDDDYDYGDLVTAIPQRITDEYEIDDNLQMIYDIRDCALAEVDRMEAEGVITSADAEKRADIVYNIFECYAFPWMTLSYQEYWKAKNSEGGVKDFKPGNVYYGLPYISGSGKNRYYNVEKALSEDRYYDSGEGYYILNQNKLLSGKYVGNDCSGLVDVAIWGTNDSHSDDRTSEIASSSSKVYKTISDYKAMRTGDLICKGSTHVVMFLYYVNEAHTSFMMIENGGAEPGTNTVHCDIYDTSYYSSKGYKVRRLKSLG